MNLKKDKDGNVALVPPIITDGFHYELFHGEYIKPEYQLDEESARRVREAVEVIKQYERFLKVNDLLVEM